MQQLEGRRHEVDDADLVGHLARGTPGPETISGMCVAGVVDEEAVGLLAVLAEHLAVVARDDDQRLVEPAVELQRVEQPADLRVGCAISAS